MKFRRHREPSLGGLRRTKKGCPWQPFLRSRYAFLDGIPRLLGKTHYRTLLSDSLGAVMGTCRRQVPGAAMARHVTRPRSGLGASLAGAAPHRASGARDRRSRERSMPKNARGQAVPETVPHDPSICSTSSIGGDRPNNPDEHTRISLIAGSQTIIQAKACSALSKRSRSSFG